MPAQFSNKDLIVVVDFDKNQIAEGVSFLSQDVSDNIGKNSYVNKNYKKIVKWAAGGKTIKIEKNKTTDYPVEIYIGNIHE